MVKTWKDWDYDDCPECGGFVEVLTATDQGFCFDGDKVRCTECSFRSAMSVDGENGEAWIQEGDE